MSNKIAVIGLGYVGLPLAIEFGKIIDTVGFDIDTSRITQLQNGIDNTFEVDSNELSRVKKLKYTSNKNEISNCDIYIITVPTPVDENKQPDLSLIKEISKTVGKLLSINDLVIYESTVFPGATEEICVPILEKYSGFKYNQDFFCGYSPERVNPGDKKHRINRVVKVTSGSTPQTATKVDNLYKKIIDAGTHKVSSIKVAEAAKIIENTQRDLNIALVNEFAIIFDKLGIDTEEILEAAETKWNFLPFRPGLVGGHCIGVDPYYLAYKSNKVGYQPELIMAGRKINDNMGSFVVKKIINLMSKKNILLNNANILIMGLAFKEDCTDIRNTRVIDIYSEFKDLSCNVDIFDPLVNPSAASKEYGVSIISEPKQANYDVVILAVAHKVFKKISVDKINSFGKSNFVLFDIKYLINKELADGRL